MIAARSGSTSAVTARALAQAGFTGPKIASNSDLRALSAWSIVTCKPRSVRLVASRGTTCGLMTWTWREFTDWRKISISATR